MFSSFYIQASCLIVPPTNSLCVGAVCLALSAEERPVLQVNAFHVSSPYITF